MAPRGTPFLLARYLVTHSHISSPSSSSTPKLMHAARIYGGTFPNQRQLGRSNPALLWRFSFHHHSIRNYRSPSNANWVGGGPVTHASAQQLGPVRKVLSRSLLVEGSQPHVSLKKLSGSDAGLLEVILDRPGSRNAIGVDMLSQLQTLFEEIHSDPSARVMLLYSSVPGVFCAGADLKERRKMLIQEAKKYTNNLRSTFSFLEALCIPTIAVIEGAALGGGLELALSCDLRICGDKAIFGMPETSLAIIPGAGGTQRLPRLIGKSCAKELIFTARRIDAKYAQTIGLVNHCVTSGNAYMKALEVAREILQQGPLAVRMAKIAIDRGAEVEATSGMVLEEACYAQILHSKDRLEGLAAFAEKRKPFYSGE